jgi:hypothetical protein
MSKLIALAATVVAVAAFAGPSYAAKGGHNNTVTSFSASVSASPNPAPSGGARVYLSGCGYAPSNAVMVTVTHSSGASQTFWVGMWSTGCMDNAYFLTAEPGTYTIQVWQSNGNANSLMASTSLSVV